MKKLTLLFTMFFLFESCKKDYQLEKIDSDVLVIADKQDSNIELRCAKQSVNIHAVILKSSTLKRQKTMKYMFISKRLKFPICV